MLKPILCVTISLFSVKVTATPAHLLLSGGSSPAPSSNILFMGSGAAIYGPSTDLISGSVSNKSGNDSFSNQTNDLTFPVSSLPTNYTKEIAGALSGVTVYLLPNVTGLSLSINPRSQTNQTLYWSRNKKGINVRFSGSSPYSSQIATTALASYGTTNNPYNISNVRRNKVTLSYWGSADTGINFLP